MIAGPAAVGCRPRPVRSNSGTPNEDDRAAYRWRGRLAGKRKLGALRTGGRRLPIRQQTALAQARFRFDALNPEGLLAGLTLALRLRLLLGPVQFLVGAGQ
jgi:hypothetical protein